MAKNANKTRKTVEEVMTEAQAITVTGPIDHHTQISSWTPEAPAEELDLSVLTDLDLESDTTDPTMPMGEDGNVLVDPEETDQPLTFPKILSELDAAEVDEMVVDLSVALDDRAEYERQMSPDNENIHKTLKKVRAAFTASKDAARVLLAVNTDTAFINRTISEGSRYNVYALGKLSDLVKGLTDGQISNAINNACMRSLFAFKAAGLPFTSALAKAAASDKIRDIDPSVKKHLIRHTVSASTASTQASSTMQALETLGIVTRSGSRRDATYTLTDSPAVQRLAEKLGIAA